MRDTQPTENRKRGQKMKTFIFINSNGVKEGEMFVVHAEGCQDIKQEERTMGNGEGYAVEALNVKEAVQSQIDEFTSEGDDESGWNMSCFTIKPCCTRKGA